MSWDATGRNTLLGTALRLKRKHQRHQSAALFAHFAGVQRREGADEGNISIYRFPAGWVWMIPLPGDCMSIGAVCYPEYLKERRGGNADFLLTTLSRIPGARERDRECAHHRQPACNRQLFLLVQSDERTSLAHGR